MDGCLDFLALNYSRFVCVVLYLGIINMSDEESQVFKPRKSLPRSLEAQRSRNVLTMKKDKKKSKNGAGSSEYLV